MLGLARKNGKIIHKVFRVSRNEIRLHVAYEGSCCEHCLAVYYRRKHKDEWQVVICSEGGVTLEALNLITSYVPAKGRHYKTERQSVKIDWITRAFAA